VTIGGEVVGGDQRKTTLGGDYAGGNIDSRQGVFVEGGVVSGGTIIGVNTGSLVIGGLGSATTDTSLAQALAQVQQAVTQARQRGDDDLADDLDGVASSLRAALKAQSEGKAERRASKIREASEALRRVTEGHGELTGIVQAVAILG
jgi:hypothetical protein